MSTSSRFAVPFLIQLPANWLILSQKLVRGRHLEAQESLFACGVDCSIPLQLKARLSLKSCCQGFLSSHWHKKTIQSTKLTLTWSQKTIQSNRLKLEQCDKRGTIRNSCFLKLGTLSSQGCSWSLIDAWEHTSCELANGLVKKVTNTHKTSVLGWAVRESFAATC